MLEAEKYARKCDVTGKGMNEGYCFGDGIFYCKNEEDALKRCVEMGYKNLEEAYNNGEYYWTEWEELDDDCYYLEDGTEINT